MLFRRQVRKKSLEDILNISPCSSKKDTTMEVNDSQFLNMNRLHGTSIPRQIAPSLTLRQIWDFIEQIGVRDQTNLEDVVRRIEDMEQRDWETFQKLASAGTPNVVRREASSSK
ncbi:hypothetical protein Ancab_036191 [Ancistrocladus abbreviatus]